MIKYESYNYYTVTSGVSVSCEEWPIFLTENNMLQQKAHMSWAIRKAETDLPGTREKQNSGYFEW